MANNRMLAHLHTMCFINKFERLLTTMKGKNENVINTWFDENELATLISLLNDLRLMYERSDE